MTIGNINIQDYGVGQQAPSIVERPLYLYHSGLYTHGAGQEVVMPSSGVTVIVTGNYTVGLETGVGFVVGDGTDGTIIIGDKGQGIYSIFYRASFTSNRVALVHASVYLNGNKLLNVSAEDTTVVGKTTNLTLFGRAFLQAGDELDARFVSSANNTTCSISHGNFMIERIGNAPFPEETNPGKDTLVSWWDLEDVIDSHDGNDLTNTNGVTFVTGKVDLAANFVSGSSQRLIIPTNSSLEMGDIDLTGACWVNGDSYVGAMRFMSKWTAGPGGEYSIFYIFGDNRYSFSLNSGAVTTSVLANNFGAPVVGEWNLIWFWYDSVANEMGIQINDGEPDTIAHVGGAQITVADFEIGSFNNGSQFMNGKIDVALLDKQLYTASDRRWIWNRGVGRKYSDL